MSETPLPLAGRTVLVTGTIEGLSRDQAKQTVVDLGGTPAAGVTGKVDLVVLGEGAGLSKTAKARSLKILVLHGPDFAALAADPGGWDGTEVGVTFAAYDAAHGEEDEEDTRVFTSDKTHWVGKATHYVTLPDGTVRRQVRLACACGHRWMREPLWGEDVCPRPSVPETVAPWHNPSALDALYAAR